MTEYAKYLSSFSKNSDSFQTHLSLIGGKYNVPDSDYDEFYNNCVEWNLIKDDKINIMDYSMKYCEMDCLVLKEGMLKFKEWILKIKKENFKQS